MAWILRDITKDAQLWNRTMLVPPPTAPPVKGREKSDPGGHALAAASQADSNPNKRQPPQPSAQTDSGDEAKPVEIQSSRLIDRSPISSATQAALLALLSEPFAGEEGGNSFAELVEEATIEQSAAAESIETAKQTPGAETASNEIETPQN